VDGLMLLRQARDARLAVAAESGKLVIRGPQRAAPVALKLLAHKPEVLAALEVADWCARHNEALAHWSAFRPAAEAERLAWAEMQNRWHRLHDERVPAWQCAGCGEPIGGLPALDFADDNRVHLDEAHGLDCLLAFGQRWRDAATAGLQAFGLDLPTDEEMEP
jgi:hypothetical protein